MFLFRILVIAVMAGSAWRGVATEAVVDPKADAILTALGAQLSSAQTAEVELRLGVKSTNGPAPVGDLEAIYSLAVARPNKIAMVLKQGALGATVVCDGTNTITVVPQPPMYTVRPAGKQIGGVDPAAADMGTMAFITALFSDNPRAALLGGVHEAKYVGREKIGAEEFDRIDMKQEGLDWRLFTSAGEKPRVRRIDVRIPHLDLSMDFTGWKLNGPIGSDRFRFTPPAEAKKVDALADAKAKEGEESDLVDEPLPKLKLKTIDDAAFDTAWLKGSVSLLVVWSGEAEHCLNAIKATSEVASAQKGVRMYTINIDEKPDRTRIKALMSKHKLNVKTVAMDQDGEAVEKLELEGTPTTFLIDKTGVIRKAYLGYHQDFPAILAKEVRALQAEKKN